MLVRLWFAASLAVGLSWPALVSAQQSDPLAVLKRLDTDASGTIDPREAAGPGRAVIDQAAIKAGMDPKQALSIQKLAAAMQAQNRENDNEDGGDEEDRGRGRGRDEDRERGRDRGRERGDDEDRGRRDDRDRDRDRDRGSSSSSSATSATATTGPTGFGEVTQNLSLPPGFDVPLEKNTRFKRPLEERFEKRVLDRVDELLRDQDLNKNGFIEYKTDEGRTRWSFPPEDSDTNKDSRLDREELCYRIAKVLGSREREATSSPGSGGSSSSTSAADTAKVRRYAEGLLKQYDANGNGQLEKDEWSKMRGDPEKADTNNDGIITADELSVRLAGFSNSEGGSSSGDSSSRDSGRDRENRGESRESRYGSRRERDSSTTSQKSYRVLSATELLPKGLPTWFTRNDADADGQVTMAEYSTSYNETIVAEFMKYDLNGDGIITPEECLVAESSGKKSSTTSSSSSRYGEASRTERPGGERPGGERPGGERPGGERPMGEGREGRFGR